MTKDSNRKKKIRARMAVTGEKYNVARRKIEAMEGVVIDLPEPPVGPAPGVARSRPIGFVPESDANG